MTSVNAELYHREFDRKNEKHARELDRSEMKTVAQWLAQRGREFPKPDSADGSTSMAAYEAARLPMVVSCTGCTMTMALHADRKIDDDGQIFCDDCASAHEEQYEAVTA